MLVTQFLINLSHDMCMTDINHSLRIYFEYLVRLYTFEVSHKSVIS